MLDLDGPAGILVLEDLGDLLLQEIVEERGPDAARRTIQDLLTEVEVAE